MSVTDVLIQLRIGHACHLLVSTELPIHRVASDSGFNNLGHFFRQFSAQRGCTPTEFRRHNRLPAAEDAVSHTRHASHTLDSATIAG